MKDQDAHRDGEERREQTAEDEDGPPDERHRPVGLGQGGEKPPAVVVAHGLEHRPLRYSTRRLDQFARTAARKAEQK